jgi:membrane-associated progesterone receptor component
MGSVGDITASQLSRYDGTNASLPILVAIRGKIYDVTSGKSFYGPGGSYAVFSGKDASRALAKMSTNSEDVVPDLDGLTDKEIGVLNDWDQKFAAKYPVVGRVSDS